MSSECSNSDSALRIWMQQSGCSITGSIDVSPGKISQFSHALGMDMCGY